MQNSIIIFSSVWIGAIIGFLLKNNKSSIPNHILVFSGGFLLSITILEIFPHLFIENNSFIGIWILLGVFIQILLEFLTKGVEHGHLHLHKESQSFPLALLIGLFLHSFIEGIPISGDSYHHEHSHSEHLVWGIFVHNLPVSFLLSYYLFNSKLSTFYSFIILFLFSISTPLGSLAGSYFPESYVDVSLAIVSGIFLHISSLIIFESNKKHHFNFIKLISILLGFIFAYLVLL